jgi:hypothetical protein
MGAVWNEAVLAESDKTKVVAFWHGVKVEA